MSKRKVPRNLGWICPTCNVMQPLQHICIRCGDIWESNCGLYACINAEYEFGRLVVNSICAYCRNQERENQDTANEERNRQRERDRDRRTPPPPSGTGGSGGCAGGAGSGAGSTAAATLVSTGGDGQNQTTQTRTETSARPVGTRSADIPRDGDDDQKVRYVELTDDELINNLGYGTYGDENLGWIRRIENEDEIIPKFIYLLEQQRRIRRPAGSEPQDGSTESQPGSGKKDDKNEKTSNDPPAREGRSQANQPGSSRGTGAATSEESATPEDLEVQEREVEDARREEIRPGLDGAARQAPKRSPRKRSPRKPSPEKVNPRKRRTESLAMEADDEDDERSKSPPTPHPPRHGSDSDNDDEGIVIPPGDPAKITARR